MCCQLVHSQQLQRLRNQADVRQNKTAEVESSVKNTLNEAYAQRGDEIHKLNALLQLARASAKEADFKTQQKDQEVEQLKLEIARQIPKLADASAQHARKCLEQQFDVLRYCFAVNLGSCSLAYRSAFV